jgi:hypothetical protein
VFGGSWHITFGIHLLTRCIKLNSARFSMCRQAPVVRSGRRCGRRGLHGQECGREAQGPSCGTQGGKDARRASPGARLLGKTSANIPERVYRIEQKCPRKKMYKIALSLCLSVIDTVKMLLERHSSFAACAAPILPSITPPAPCSTWSALPTEGRGIARWSA